jgi:hypothetical protein
MYALPLVDKDKLSSAWEAQFDKLFKLLGMKDTRLFVDQFVKPVPVTPDMKFYLGEIADVKMADDLAD